MHEHSHNVPHRYRQCIGCGKVRNGPGARGWPREALACPSCSAAARALRSFPDSALSPEPAVATHG